jgi:hypothetical protein
MWHEEVGGMQSHHKLLLLLLLLLGDADAAQEW